jgi:hypothetical protein
VEELGPVRRLVCMTTRFIWASVLAALASFCAVVAAAGGVDDLRAASVPTRTPVVRASDAEAVAFARNVVRMIAENRYDEAWPLLHPAHRRAAGRDEFVRCERLSPVPGLVVSVRVGSAFDEPAELGAGVRSPSRAVPVAVTLLDVGTSERVVVKDTVHAVRVSGRWAWVLPPERFAHYRADTCPDAAPPVPR